VQASKIKDGQLSLLLLKHKKFPRGVQTRDTHTHTLSLTHSLTRHAAVERLKITVKVTLIIEVETLCYL